MRLLLSICCLFVINALLAQTDLSKVTRLEMDGPLKVELVQADQAELTVLEEPELVKWEVNGNSLVIIASYEKNHETASIRLAMPDFRAISTIGSVIIDGKDEFAPRRLDLNISGQSIVNLTIDVEELDVEASSQSVLTLAGNADWLRVNVDKQSILNASQLKSEDITVRADRQSIVSLAQGGKREVQVSRQSIVN